jgi:hypothetical protein
MVLELFEIVDLPSWGHKDTDHQENQKAQQINIINLSREWYILYMLY